MKSEKKFFSRQNLTHYSICGWYFQTVGARQPFVRLSSDSPDIFARYSHAKSSNQFLIGRVFSSVGFTGRFFLEVKRIRMSMKVSLKVNTQGCVGKLGAISIPELCV